MTSRCSRRPGTIQYPLHPEGGTIDDLIVYRRSEDEIFICVNAANCDADVAWFKAHLSRDVEFEDLSDQLSLLAVQGPKAESLLAKFGDEKVVINLKYYWAQQTKVFGRPCYLSRTGYTGEDGFEMYLNKDDAVDVWSKLMEEGKSYGLLPIGLGARDTLRLEMGYPLHGHELSPTISPISAGLSWVVKLNKGSPLSGSWRSKKKKRPAPHVYSGRLWWQTAEFPGLAMRLLQQAMPRSGQSPVAPSARTETVP